MLLEHSCRSTGMLQQKEPNEGWSNFDLFTDNFSHQFAKCDSLQNSYSRKRSFGSSDFLQAFPFTIENSFPNSNYFQTFSYSFQCPNDFQPNDITIRFPFSRTYGKPFSFPFPISSSYDFSSHFCSNHLSAFDLPNFQSHYFHPNGFTLNIRTKQSSNYFQTIASPEQGSHYCTTEQDSHYCTPLKSAFYFEPNQIPNH